MIFQKGQSGPLLDVVVSALNLELSDTSAPSQSSSGHPKDTAAPAQLEFECTQVSLLAIANSLGTCDNIIVLKCSSVCLYETPPIRPTSTAEEAGREAMNKPRGPKNRSSDAENRFMAERLPVILHPRLDDLSKQSGDTKLPPETMLTVTISTTTQATATANGENGGVRGRQTATIGTPPIRRLGQSTAEHPDSTPATYTWV
ncbi:hypothetical protein SARC_04299 [Sphaeroforma arctica JP610]|uniref:Uncharacterized protein n=1 Tax=Sphaeroforma arctica JP610 TaxID=667725 RepID=A0A0L0G5B9_9EUKA|nr:hypothetical protein SARC_04299 [Sphaeroforma arctica JP610]KNC83458.1 hypothetical protein SARC_04299 [Sphaeroforma arctica JP610]|eukprot:XP_014157360.1 hypothetical protein SARC_04299 [Sphaeroforma arctica JP610]